MSQPNTRIVVFLLGLFVTAVRWNLKKMYQELASKTHTSLSKQVCPLVQIKLTFRSYLFSLGPDRGLRLLLFGLIWDKNKA